MAHRAATDEICVAGVWGTPHQAKGGDSSESPPAVFWLQKTLLAKTCDALVTQTVQRVISVSLQLYTQGLPVC